MAMKRKALGEILVSKGHLQEDQLRRGLEEQGKSKERLGKVLVKLGFISQDGVTQALSEQLDIPRLELSERTGDPSLLTAVPRDYLERHFAAPLEVEDGVVVVAMADPLDVHTADDMRLLLGMPVRVVLSSEEDILDCLQRSYAQEESVEKVVSDMSEADLEIVAEQEEEVKNLQEMANEAPVIRLVNAVISQAVKERATDIHIESYEHEVLIRYRVDGILYELNRLPKRLQAPIISRVKIMASLNIAERRLPQDGRIKLKVFDREIDMRISTVPTMFGESVVMRILDRAMIMLTLKDIGFLPDVYEKYDALIQMPHGILLVTGPTGSGKTTTLYASLNKIRSSEVKIITIEDPVEYQLDGVNQIHVNPKIGLSFANGLRSILRQDPDIIMVGEIRDRETAEIAVQSALTGHLVFSTLHTNDAPGAITRLLDMGIENFLVASSVIGIMAQRLVRKICESCREEIDAPRQTLRKLGIHDEGPQRVYQGRGCEACANGYLGRTGIYEILVIDEAIRNLILHDPSIDVVRQQAIQGGMLTLLMDGWQKVRQGITTLEELLRMARSTVTIEV